MERELQCAHSPHKRTGHRSFGGAICAVRGRRRAASHLPPLRRPNLARPPGANDKSAARKNGAMDHRAAFFIARSEDHLPDPRHRNRAGAHRAGFQRHIKMQAGEAIIAARFCRFADRNNFGMRGRVMGLNRCVAACRDHFACIRVPDHSPDRHFSRRACRFGLQKGKRHGGQRCFGCHHASRD